MKKNILILLMILLVVSCVACNGNNGNKLADSSDAGDKKDLIEENKDDADTVVQEIVEEKEEEFFVIPEDAETISDTAYAYVLDENTIIIAGTGKVGDIDSHLKRLANSKGISTYDIVIEEGITALIGSFNKCSNIKSIQLPSTLQEINYSAFSNCDQLEEIILPDDNSLMWVDKAGFIGTPWFEKNQRPGEFLMLNNVLVDASGVTDTEVIVPHGVVVIGESAFENRKDIISVQLPETIRCIGHQSFYRCDNTVVNIPDSVEKIGNMAFGLCKLMEVQEPVEGEEPQKNILVLPSALTYLGSGAFIECNSLDEVVIPDTLKSIEYSTFQKCTRLSKIEIPEGVVSIGEHAFKSCWELKEVDIPDSVVYVGREAFDSSGWKGDRPEEKGYMIVNGSLISWSAWSNDIVIPEGVTVLPDKLNLGGSITSVTLPDSIKYIGDEVFSGYGELRTINLPEGLEVIGQEAFYECRQLEEVIIPSTVKEIGAEAFKQCTAIKEITIPSSVARVEEGTMDACVSLERVILCEGVKYLDCSALDETSNLKELYLPSSLEEIVDVDILLGLNATIYCKADSTIAKILDENGITYVE